MAFGAGVLISAVAFELTEEAYRSAGASAAAFGLAPDIAIVVDVSPATDVPGDELRRRYTDACARR